MSIFLPTPFSTDISAISPWNFSNKGDSIDTDIDTIDTKVSKSIDTEVSKTKDTNFGVTSEARNYANINRPKYGVIDTSKSAANDKWVFRRQSEKSAKKLPKKSKHRISNNAIGKRSNISLQVHRNHDWKQDINTGVNSVIASEQSRHDDFEFGKKEPKLRNTIDTEDERPNRLVRIRAKRKNKTDKARSTLPPKAMTKKSLDLHEIAGKMYMLCCIQ